MIKPCGSAGPGNPLRRGVVGRDELRERGPETDGDGEPPQAASTNTAPAIAVQETKLLIEIRN